MTESYSELPNFLTATTQSNFEVNTENSSGYEINGAENDKIEKEINISRRPKSLICDKTFPYNLEGTVSRDGDMTHFVAENLEYKIKLSSPITKTASSGGSGNISGAGTGYGGGNSSSKNSTPSAPLAASGTSQTTLLPHNFLQNTYLSQIDSNVLNDIELEAQYLAASLDNLTENLCNLLHSISSITADNIEIHKNAVNKLTDCMDANIKCMYTIMAKTEEISKSMKPVEQLAIKIREIKKLVDMLENNL